MKRKDFILNLIYYIIPMVLIIPLSIWGIYQMDKASYECFFVVGPSMQPTLNGDAENSTYGYSDNSSLAIDNLKRFDLVICYYPFENSQDYDSPYIRNHSPLKPTAALKVKRVIGLPGDSLEINNEIFSISYSENGQRNTDTYGGENLPVPFERSTPIENREANITLGDGEYFVMGDNWTKGGSTDSCNPSSGSKALPIYRENIKGVIFKLSGLCTYANCKHCDSCKSIVDNSSTQCKCGGNKFSFYYDIIDERPFEDGPIYLK